MIVFNEKSVTISKEDGTVFANIFLDFKKSEFYPQKEWNDFAAVILGWWAREIIDYMNEKVDPAEFCFMDGSYLFSITHEFNSDVLRCYHDPYSSKKIINEEVIDIAEFISDLKFCINQLLRIIGKRKAKLEALPEYLQLLNTLVIT